MIQMSFLYYIKEYLNYKFSLTNYVLWDYDTLFSLDLQKTGTIQVAPGYVLMDFFFFMLFIFIAHRVVIIIKNKNFFNYNNNILLRLIIKIILTLSMVICFKLFLLPLLLSALWAYMYDFSLFFSSSILPALPPLLAPWAALWTMYIHGIAELTLAMAPTVPHNDDFLASSLDNQPNPNYYRIRYILHMDNQPGGPLGPGGIGNQEGAIVPHGQQMGNPMANPLGDPAEDPMVNPMGQHLGLPFGQHMGVPFQHPYAHLLQHPPMQGQPIWAVVAPPAPYILHALNDVPLDIISYRLQYTVFFHLEDFVQTPEGWVINKQRYVSIIVQSVKCKVEDLILVLPDEEVKGILGPDSLYTNSVHDVEQHLGFQIISHYGIDAHSQLFTNWAKLQLGRHSDGAIVLSAEELRLYREQINLSIWY